MATCAVVAPDNCLFADQAGDVFKIDSLNWLKDESLDDADDRPDPEEHATDAISELEGAVSDLTEVIAVLENGNNDRAAQPQTPQHATGMPPAGGP